jgi:hypothetical protein
MANTATTTQTRRQPRTTAPSKSAGERRRAPAETAKTPVQSRRSPAAATASRAVTTARTTAQEKVSAVREKATAAQKKTAAAQEKAIAARETAPDRAQDGSAVTWREVPMPHVRIPVPHMELPGVQPIIAPALWTARSIMSAVPEPKRLLFYGGIGALTVVGLLEWPVAAAVAAGMWVATHPARGATRQGADGPRRTPTVAR